MSGIIGCARRRRDITVMFAFGQTIGDVYFRRRTRRPGLSSPYNHDCCLLLVKSIPSNNGDVEQTLNNSFIVNRRVCLHSDGASSISDNKNKLRFIVGEEGGINNSTDIRLFNHSMRFYLNIECHIMSEGF